MPDVSAEVLLNVEIAGQKTGEKSQTFRARQRVSCRCSIETLLLLVPGCLYPRWWRLFWEITLPLTISSALIAVLLVFIGVFGDFVVSKTAGPTYPNSLSLLLQAKASLFQDWGGAACIGVVMVFTAWMVVPLFMAALWSLVDPEYGWSYKELLPSHFSLYLRWRTS